MLKVILPTELFPSLHGFKLTDTIRCISYNAAPIVAQVDLRPSSVTYCKAPADLEVRAVLLPHPLECWNYRHKTPAYFEEEVLTHGRMVRFH